MDWFESAKADLKELKARQEAWDKSFTRRGREVLAAAASYARGLRHDYVGVEHLLFGITESVGGVAARILRKHGVSSDTVLNEFGRPTDTDADQKRKLPLPFSPRLKSVTAHARDEARLIGHPCTDAEHLLLSLLNERRGPVADLCKKLALDRSDARRQILACAKTPGK